MLVIKTTGNLSTGPVTLSAHGTDSGNDAQGLDQLHTTGIQWPTLLALCVSRLAAWYCYVAEFHHVNIVCLWQHVA